MDGGLSRILYADLRKLFVEKSEYQTKVDTALKFYSSVGYLIFLLFSTFSFILYHFCQNSFNLIVIFLLAIGISLNVLLSYIKSIFASIDRFEQYERIDIIRKVLNLLAIGLIVFDETMILTSIFTALFSIILLVYSYYLLSGKLFIKNLSFDLASLKLFKETFSTSKNIVLFSISEAFIYNAGFLIIPIIYTSYEVIQFGLWMKIFMGLAVLIRFATDINIHQITKKYFEKSKNTTLKLFKNTMIISVLIMGMSFFCFFMFKDVFFVIWVKNKYQLNNYMFIALFILLFGNSIQHISGSFLISTGKNFSLIRRNSLLVCFIHIFIYLMSFIFNIKLGILLIILEIVYFSMSIVYVKNSIDEINLIP
jgi:O-antigen/teichoic acid export membrane protein